MKSADLYSFGPDGTLWTRTTGGSRRPASVEEMEGYCRERHGAVHYPVFKTNFPQIPFQGEQVPLSAA
jgi:hypothetical protein